MLNRFLLILDVLLLVAMGTLGLHLHRVWTDGAAVAAPAATAPASPGPAAPGAATPAGPAPALTTFGVVAERNLFSPTRNEVSPEPPKPTAAPVLAGPAAPKPRLYGVVMGRDGGARAYLEDPRTRKVFGYGVGDTVAESRIEQINTDRVVLRRGAETFEVLLRDPSKPKPAVPVAAAPTQPGSPRPGSLPVPGGRPPAMPGTTPDDEIPQVPVPGQHYDPHMQPGGAPVIPGGPIVSGQPQVVPGQPPGPPGRQLPTARPPVPGRFPRMPGTVPGLPSAPYPGQPPGASGS